MKKLVRNKIVENKRVYITEFGTFNWYHIWYARIAVVSLILLAISHINENPIGILISIGLLIIFLFFISTEKFILYDKELVIQRNFLLGLIPIRSKYKISEINELQISGNMNFMIDILVFLFFGMRISNKLYLELDNGKSKKYRTFIYFKNLEAFRGKFDELKKASS